MNTSQKFFFVLRFSFPMHFGGKRGLNTMNITVHLKMGAFGPLCPNYIRHLDSEMKHEKQILVLFPITGVMVKGTYNFCKISQS